MKPDESGLQALRRELSEEVNIQIEYAHPLMQISHDYPDHKINLNAWVIDRWSGTPLGNEGQAVEWVAIKELDNRQLPDANIKITKAIKLPLLYLITPDLISYDDRFLILAEQLVNNGLGLLQFRSKCSTFFQHESFVRELVQVCENGACQLIYNGTVDNAVAVGAHGVHLNSSTLLRIYERPLSNDAWVAASCHNRMEIEHAIRADVDFCVVSPVHQTSSHTGDEGMGWNRFQELAEQTCIPIYALGGIKPAEIVDAHRNGAHGIAMIRGIWDAPDPVELINKFKRGDVSGHSKSV